LSLIFKKQEERIKLKEKVPKANVKNKSISRNISPMKGTFRTRDLLEDNKIELISLEVETSS
jgi:hypothetical protein